MSASSSFGKKLLRTSGFELQSLRGRDSFMRKSPCLRGKHSRQIFDEISLGVISFLEKHIGVTDVKFEANTPITDEQIEEFEAAQSVELPSDLSSFLRLMNGFSFQWHMKFKGGVLPLGFMELLPLSEMKAVDVSGSALGGRLAFRIDNGPNGIVALVFGQQSQSDSKDAAIDAIDDATEKSSGQRLATTQVWFQDLGCAWNFVADSFSDYFRLLVLHLGLPNWQLAFTGSGLEPATVEWMRFMIPSRLRTDLRHSAGAGWLMPLRKVPRRKLRKTKLNLQRIDHIVKHSRKDKTWTRAVAKKR